MSLWLFSSEESPCRAAEFSRWDKLFIALEDSHMRQSMLLESLERCCGEVVPLRARIDQLAAKGTCEECGPRMESACQRQAEQTSLRVQRGLVELREEEAVRESRLNVTLQVLLQNVHEDGVRLKRLEEGGDPKAADGRMGRLPTPRPGGLGAALGFGMKPFPSGHKEQEVTSPLDMATVEKALVAIATELQRVHLQLSGVIEQTRRKDRGDT